MGRVFLFFLAIYVLPLHAKEYSFVVEPIDAVIVCSKKDVATLDFCIESLRKYVDLLRRVIVVSEKPLTANAEWFDEKKYPFTLSDLGAQIFPRDPKKARWFSTSCWKRGWIYQQLLKFYAPLIIPGISSNVLVVDADLIFFRPVEFLTESGAGLYNVGGENYPPYFEHMARLLPSLHRVFPQYSGITHHMLFQRCVIDDLFADIVKEHGKEPWQAICACIDPGKTEDCCLSEYEIYFNYLFARNDQVKVRPLKWKDGGKISKEIFLRDAAEGCHYTAYHDWARW